MLGARPARSLKARALQWLAQREHSRAELKRKLLPHALAEAARSGAPADDAADASSSASLDRGAAADVAQARVDEVLDWLEARQYLSMARFVESRVHARASRYGNLRIRQELARHEASLSDTVGAALVASEFDRAHAVWQRKFGGAAPEAAADRARQARFLSRRGFSPEVVHRVLRLATVEPSHLST